MNIYHQTLEKWIIKDNNGSLYQVKKSTGIVSGYVKLPYTEKYQYISPWIFNCNCDTLVFHTWILKTLPYLPDLNPIEHSWDTTKNEVRNNQNKEVCFVDKLC